MVTGKNTVQKLVLKIYLSTFHGYKINFYLLECEETANESRLDSDTAFGSLTTLCAWFDSIA